MESGGKRACRKHEQNQKRRGENKQLLYGFSSRFKLSVLVSGDEQRMGTEPEDTTLFRSARDHAESMSRIKSGGERTSSFFMVFPRGSNCRCWFLVTNHGPRPTPDCSRRWWNHSAEFQS